MAQTPEERKIKRLEAELSKYKRTVKDLREEKEVLENNLTYERQWRMDFQHLMKAAVQEDKLGEYERRY